MVSNVKNALAAISVFSFVGASNADTQKVEFCPGDSERSVTQVWENSEARATLIDNNGSQARIERGKTYAAFMDSFWGKMESISQDNPAETIGDVFDQIQTSFTQANTDAGAKVRGVKVTPSIQIDGGYDGKTHHGFSFSLDNAADMKVTDDSRLKEYLSSGRGIGIGVMFQSDVTKDYIIQPVTYKDMFKGQKQSMDAPVSEFRKVTQRHESYWEEANVTDGIVCQID